MPNRLSRLLGIAGIAAGVFLWRFGTLSDIEPRIDQASVARWVRDLRRVDHVLPPHDPAQSFRSAIERDNTGFLNQYVIRIYNKPWLGFNSFPVAAVYLLSFATDDSYRAQVGISILASIAVLIVLACFPIGFPTDAADATAQKSTDSSVRLGAMILAGTTAYLHFFSPWGVHNFGILALIAAAALISATNRSGSSLQGDFHWKAILAAAFATSIALYSHWTNLFLLLPAGVVYMLFFGPPSWRRRLLRTIAYLALVAVLTAPVLLFFLVLKSPLAESDTAYSGFGQFGVFDYLTAAGARGIGWLLTGSQMFSPPGVLTSILGLVFLAKKRRVVFPLLVVLTHWVATTLVPGFGAYGSDTSLRTFPYVLPFFCLGTAYFLVAGIRGEFADMIKWRASWAIPLVAAILVFAHMSAQVAAFVASGDGASRVPMTWKMYRQGQGTLRQVVKGIDSQLPPDATLLAWTYPLQDLYVTLSARNPGRPSLPPLESQIRRLNAGTFPDYFKRRRLALPCDGAVFMFSPAEIPPHEIEKAFSDILHAASPNCVDRQAVRISSWQTGVEVYGDVVLYALEKGGSEADSALHAGMLKRPRRSGAF